MENYGVRTSCNLFFEGIINGRKRNLQEVRCIKNEIKEAGYFWTSRIESEHTTFQTK